MNAPTDEYPTIAGKVNRQRNHGFKNTMIVAAMPLSQNLSHTHNKIKP
jgi:hypothetical protein